MKETNLYRGGARFSMEKKEILEKCKKFINMKIINFKYEKERNDSRRIREKTYSNILENRSQSRKVKKEESKIIQGIDGIGPLKKLSIIFLINLILLYPCASAQEQFYTQTKWNIQTLLIYIFITSVFFFLTFVVFPAKRKLGIYLDTSIIFGYFLVKHKELRGKKVELPSVFRFLYNNKKFFNFFISPIVQAEVFRRLRTELRLEERKIRELWEDFLVMLGINFINPKKINLKAIWDFVLKIVSKVSIKKRFTNLEHLALSKQFNLYFLTGDKEVLKKCKRFYSEVISYLEFRKIVENYLDKRKKSRKMKGVVYIDLLIIAVFMVGLISFVSFIGYRAREVIVESKIKEEFQLISQQILTAINRFSELGKENPIQPEVNESELLGVFDLQIPPKIVRKNYEIQLVSRSGIWINVQNFTFNGEKVNYLGEGPNAKIVMKTLDEPIITFEQPLPNFGIEIEGKFKSGLPAVMRYYRYNLDGKIYDAIVLSSHLIIHLEELN